jgi:hypothetical protein
MIKTKNFVVLEDLIINQIVYFARLAVPLTRVEGTLRLGNKNKKLRCFVLYFARLAVPLQGEK